MALKEESCHGHAHSQSSQATSSTVVDEKRSHPSGILCLTSPRSYEESWLNEIDDPESEQRNRDVELGPPNFERVVLLIGGLQCGCCEGGISRAIARITAIRNHQVNIVLARLDFDLDTNRLSVADVITKLGTKTGYTFQELVVPTGQVLEMLVTDHTKLQDAGIPFGITRIESLENQFWSPSRLIGGRDSTYI